MKITFSCPNFHVIKITKFFSKPTKRFSMFSSLRWEEGQTSQLLQSGYKRGRQFLSGFQHLYAQDSLIDQLCSCRSKAEAKARAVMVFSLYTHHHHQPPQQKLFLSSLWLDLSMWGHFLIVLNLRYPNMRSAHMIFMQQCQKLRHI